MSSEENQRPYSNRTGRASSDYWPRYLAFRHHSKYCLYFMLDQWSDSCTATEGKLSFLNHPSFDLGHVENGNYVHLRWKGAQTLSTIKAGCQQLHEFLLASGADKVLNDGRDVVGSWTSSIPWIVYCFLPRLRTAGVRKAAHVLAQERKSHMSAHAFRLYADFCEWNFELFRTLGEAEDWLIRELSRLST